MRTSLYRHFDAGGRLLYIGISKAHLSRLVFHKRTATWYWDIARIEIEHFETFEDAKFAEAEAISEESPLYNLQGIPGRCARGHYPGRTKVMTPEREKEAGRLINEGKRGNEVWRALEPLPGPPISRAAYYVWQKKHDGDRSKDRKRKYRIG